jgi:hypothetical protein
VQRGWYSCCLNQMNLANMSAFSAASSDHCFLRRSFLQTCELSLFLWCSPQAWLWKRSAIHLAPMLNVEVTATKEKHAARLDGDAVTSLLSTRSAHSVPRDMANVEVGLATTAPHAVQLAGSVSRRAATTPDASQHLAAQMSSTNSVEVLVSKATSVARQVTSAEQQTSTTPIAGRVKPGLTSSVVAKAGLALTSQPAACTASCALHRTSTTLSVSLPRLTRPLQCESDV